MTQIPANTFSGINGRDLLRAIARFTEPGGPEGECWDWQGGFTRDKRGRKSYPVLSRVVGSRRRLQGTHRVSFEAAYGPLPPGEKVHHRCSRRTCVRPEHLQAVSATANAAEMLTRTALESRIAYLESVVRELLGHA